MLSDNIKTIRKSKGLSQEELAIKLNIHHQTTNKIIITSYSSCVEYLGTAVILYQLY